LLDAATSAGATRRRFLLGYAIEVVKIPAAGSVAGFAWTSERC